MDEKLKSLVQKLEKYPSLQARLEEMIKVVENISGEFEVADDVEERLIPEVRGMGRDLMQVWAQDQMEKKVAEVKHQKNVKRHTKKN